MMLLTLLDIITMSISRDALRATILNELKFNGNGFSYRRKLGTHLLFRTEKDLNVRVIRHLLTQKSETHQFRNTNLTQVVLQYFSFKTFQTRALF